MPSTSSAPRPLSPYQETVPPGRRGRAARWLAVVALTASSLAQAKAYYTTKGETVIDRVTGQTVELRGFGLGGWLLPEGYMWGSDRINRPRQFEQAVEDLIGPEDAKRFWRLYRDNYVTQSDIAAMRSWGANTLRIPLLASQLQPRDGQPAQPPYLYSEEGFAILDHLVDWCEKAHIGIIWDLHGAPGAQNRENISDSDGQARLWTESSVYFPRCVDLWRTIAKRYKGRPCIVGYDLLNEPLLARYSGIDVSLLRKLYVQASAAIRAIDPDGIIFVEGDDWAQAFGLLEPLDWDPHLVMAFHSYPPTGNAGSLKAWSDLRAKYHIPLWHGETGEQGPPYAINERTTRFLASAHVGWSWWTDKKIGLETQPWTAPRTAAFQRILDYWSGEGPRPDRLEAKEALFEQARLLNTRTCTFHPGMVDSLFPLDASAYDRTLEEFGPEIITQPQSAKGTAHLPVSFSVQAAGNHLAYQWSMDGVPIDGARGPDLSREALPSQAGRLFTVAVSNRAGLVRSVGVSYSASPYAGPVIRRAHGPTGDMPDSLWANAPANVLRLRSEDNPAEHKGLAAQFRAAYDDDALYLLVEVRSLTHFPVAHDAPRSDGVTVLIDAADPNDASFHASEHSFRVLRGKTQVLRSWGPGIEGVSVAQSDGPDGYRFRFRIPWPNSRPLAGGFISLEVLVGDNAGAGRYGVLYWQDGRFRQLSNPSNLGILRLETDEAPNG